MSRKCSAVAAGMTLFAATTTFFLKPYPFIGLVAGIDTNSAIAWNVAAFSPLKNVKGYVLSKSQDHIGKDLLPHEKSHLRSDTTDVIERFRNSISESRNRQTSQFAVSRRLASVEEAPVDRTGLPGIFEALGQGAGTVARALVSPFSTLRNMVDQIRDARPEKPPGLLGNLVSVITPSSTTRSGNSGSVLSRVVHDVLGTSRGVTGIRPQAVHRGNPTTGQSRVSGLKPTDYTSVEDFNSLLTLSLLPRRTAAELAGELQAAGAKRRMRVSEQPSGDLLTQIRSSAGTPASTPTYLMRSETAGKLPFMKDLRHW